MKLSQNGTKRNEPGPNQTNDHYIITDALFTAYVACVGTTTATSCRKYPQLLITLVGVHTIHHITVFKKTKKMGTENSRKNMWKKKNVKILWELHHLAGETDDHDLSDGKQQPLHQSSHVEPASPGNVTSKKTRKTCLAVVHPSCTLTIAMCHHSIFYPDAFLLAYSRVYR